MILIQSSLLLLYPMPCLYLANFGINDCLIMSSLVHLDSLFQYYGHVYKHHFAKNALFTREQYRL